MLNKKTVLNTLKQQLSKSRFEHSIRVATRAQTLAKQQGVSEEDAYFAGILHDIAKPASPDNTYGKKIHFSEEEIQLYREFPSVWHAFVGPKYVAACCGEIRTEISIPI